MLLAMRFGSSEKNAALTPDSVRIRRTAGIGALGSSYERRSTSVFVTGSTAASAASGIGSHSSHLKREPQGGEVMTDSVYKVIELVGTSEASISKAIDGAISKAGETVRHLGWFEVTQIRGRVEDGKINSYQVTLKAGFRLED
jgi:dodecin